MTPPADIPSRLPDGRKNPAYMAWWRAQHPAAAPQKLVFQPVPAPRGCHGTAHIALYKGAKGRADSWKVRLCFERRVINRTLLAATVDDARAEARDALQLLNDDGRKARKGAFAVIYASATKVLTIGDILAAYQDTTSDGHALVGGLENMRRNAQQLHIVIADGLGMDRTAEGWRMKVNALPATVLSVELVLKYQAARQRARGLEKFEPGKPREMNVGINSTLNNAKCVFSRQARAYNLRGLKLPDITGFLKAPFLKEPPKQPKEFDPGAIRRMDDVMPALRTVDLERWLFLRTMRFCGLRPRELMNARADWLLRRADGQWCIDIKTREAQEYWIKGREPRVLPLPDELMDVFTGREGWLIAPQETYRRGDCRFIRGCSEFMRQFFPASEFTKSTYLLRGMYLTAMNEKYDHETAQRAGGHTIGSSVTRDNYLRQWSDIPLLSLADLNDPRAAAKH